MNLSSPKKFGFSLFDRLFGYIDSLRPVDRWIFSILLILVAVTSAYNLYALSRAFLVNQPVSGGVLIEGAIGSPRFINPVLAITKADNDLSALTYSGLLRLQPDGSLANDLAESITISDDGRVYNVILKKDRHFHDGTSVTSDDVAFTISLIQKPDLKSPLRGNWSGVTVEVIDTYELNLVLENPYAPFRENLTLGILPKHVWSSLSDEELPFSQHNIEPVGSGIYQVERVAHSPAGLISEYELRPSLDYQKDSNIESIVFRFYQSEEEIVSALANGEITSTAYLSERWLPSLNNEQYKSVSEPLPRVFSIFFNQNKNPGLRDPAARAALEVLVDRDELIAQVLGGYGEAAISPIPPDWVPGLSSEPVKMTREERVIEARRIMEEGGWKQSVNGRWVKSIDGTEVPLLFAVRAVNGELFEKIAAYLNTVWQEVGFEATFEFYEQSDLVQTVIRPRDYQALLFGVDVGRTLDLYPFWHSSGREDPGLNVSLYANITVDKLVTDMRSATSSEARDQQIIEFVKEIDKEKPAVFLFAPSFEYVLRSNINTPEMKRLQKPSERFSNINEWHMNEGSVWPIFKND